MFSATNGTTVMQRDIGRQGQRQNGVDIYGKPRRGKAGVQCKGKRRWPPPPLKISDIDKEVAAAKKFKPRLTECIKPPIAGIV